MAFFKSCKRSERAFEIAVDKAQYRISALIGTLADRILHGDEVYKEYLGSRSRDYALRMLHRTKS